MVSHPYVTLDAHGDPLRLTHQKILEEEHAKTYHVVDVLVVCHRIYAIA